MSLLFKREYTWLFYCLVLCLYLLFPSQNHSMDAWGYAGNVRWGNELFAPHHLFYTLTGWVWVKTIHIFAPAAGVLALLLAMNAIAGTLCIIVLSGILNFLGRKGWERIGLLGIAAFSFGFWRFTTENETYILPILFSLLGSHYFIRLERDGNKRHAFLSGLFAVIACLYHQIHIFWWAGLFIGILLNKNRGKASASWYLLPLILIPLSYSLVLAFYNHVPLSFYGLWQFALHDVYAGGAGYVVQARHFLLGGISFLRTFFQVHGYLKYFFSSGFLFWLPAGVVFLLFIRMIRMPRFSVHSQHVFFVHILILVLQLLFAVYNVGNAEFMAMLPAVLVIILSCVHISSKVILHLSAALFVWNLCYGILVLHKAILSADAEITDLAAHPGHFIISSEHGIVSNRVYYISGKYPVEVLKPPSYYIERGKPTSILSKKIDSLLRMGQVLLTDCTGRPSIINRSYLVNKFNDRVFFEDYRLAPYREYPTSFGRHTLFKVGFRN